MPVRKIDFDLNVSIIDPLTIGIDSKSKGLISLISFKVINLGAEDVHGRLYMYVYL